MKRLLELTNVYSKDEIAEGQHSVCYVQTCSDFATIFVRLPLNERVTCTVKVCKRCLAKFANEGKGIEVVHDE